MILCHIESDISHGRLIAQWSTFTVILVLLLWYLNYICVCQVTFSFACRNNDSPVSVERCVYCQLVNSKTCWKSEHYWIYKRRFAFRDQVTQRNGYINMNCSNPVHTLQQVRDHISHRPNFIFGARLSYFNCSDRGHVWAQGEDVQTVKKWVCVKWTNILNIMQWILT